MKHFNKVAVFNVGTSNDGGDDDDDNDDDDDDEDDDDEALKVRKRPLSDDWH